MLVPGNHDHGLAEPWLSRLRLDGDELEPDGEWAVGPEDGAAGRLAAAMPDVELRLAYPGLWLRPDVYATHGHYLDLALTVPRLESIAASAMGRLTGRGRNCRSAADYEAVLGPIYAFYGRLAESAGPEALSRGGALSRTVWKQVTGESRAGRLLLGRVAIPGAVGALDRLGLGPFHPELTGLELRRAGLLAMGRVAEALAPAAEHVVFGHTHRAGPLAGDDLAEWTTLSGTRLWNSGTWFHESAFIDDADTRNPYLPGTVLTVGDEGPPRARQRARRLRHRGQRLRLGRRCAERVGGLVELAQAPAERPRERRPERGVAPVLVEVPALAAAGDPDGALHLRSISAL